MYDNGTMSLTTQDLSQIRTVVVDAVNDAIDALVTPRFDELENRMDRLEEQVGRLEARVSSLEERLTALEVVQNETNRRLSDMERRLSSIEADIATVKNDVMALYELAGKPMVLSFDKGFDALSNVDKLRTLHDYNLKLAKHLGIKL